VTPGEPTDRVSILLVDDDRKCCRLVSQYLKPHGYEVSCAHTGPDGLELALSGGFHVIVGLEIGADDYLPKTSSTRELLARLRAMTRRAFEWVGENSPEFEKPIASGALRIDPGQRVATLGDAVLELTRMEFDLLLLLARSAGRVLSREQLLRHAAGRDYDSFDRSVYVHMSSLRRKLGDDPDRPTYIKTIRGVGYMFLGKSGSEQ
jgi:DNA-binding response OmpR family regulator